ncbi:hypothetical protein GW17_00051491 [Ensete ventricosum]|nr:hypothetical protein GW17_00051491 [Ensete ventricosum]
MLSVSAHLPSSFSFATASSPRRDLSSSSSSWVKLRLVLELATDAELIELEHILFEPRFICCSFFSPLLKSITSKRDADFTVNGEYIEEREDFIEHLESQFLYLAADARATLRLGTFKNSVYMQIVTEDKVLGLGYGYIIWNRAAQCARLSGCSE